MVKTSKTQENKQPQKPKLLESVPLISFDSFLARKTIKGDKYKKKTAGLNNTAITAKPKKLKISKATRRSEY